jgi:hypothetical protein
LEYGGRPRVERCTPKQVRETFRTTNLGTYYRSGASDRDPVLAVYEHGAFDPHCHGCHVVRGFEVPFQVAIGLNQSMPTDCTRFVMSVMGMLRQ